MTDEIRVNVLSCVGAARDRDLVGHFVRHYLDLGVPTDRIHLIVHADHDESQDLEELLGILSELDLEPAETWRGIYTSGDMWRHRRALQRRAVPADEWVLSADVDELHMYPAPLAEVVDHLQAHELNLLQGPMIDRVAEGGVLARVDPRRPLPEQFPIVADVMCALGGIGPGDNAGGTVKMMLFRGDVFPGIGGHGPWVPEHGPRRREGIAYAAGRALAGFPQITDGRWRLAQPFAVHHYKWTEGLAAALDRRRAAPGASRPGSAYGSRLIEYLDRNGGRIRLRDVTVAGGPDRPRGLLSRLRATRRHPTPGDRAPAPEDSWQERLRAMRADPPPPPPDTPRKRPLSQAAPLVANGWRVRKLTDGTVEGMFHSHSYYDIPVLDARRTAILAHRARIEDRWMRPQDTVTVGVVDRERGGFEPIAETPAWSWQQGPLAQWVPCSRRLVWNDREDGQFVGRIHDLDTGVTRTLPRSTYALAPGGETALGVNMARLSRARPGYGYFGGDTRGCEVGAPDDDGVWSIGLDDGSEQLVLSLAAAVEFLHSALPDDTVATLRATPHLYWFNHVKLSPEGNRFTVKLRWRVADLEEPWTGLQSASLTVDRYGGDVHLLCRAASHVMWRNETELICWDEGRERLAVLDDRAPVGRLVRDLPADVFSQNVHIHPLRDRPGHYLYDVPYGRTVQLRLYDEESGADHWLAQFERHIPAHGPFRCDLHPVPTADGDLTVFTSLHDGGRQVYVLERET